MSNKLRSVEDLAKEVGGKAKATKLLAKQGVRVIDGHFLARRLEASLSEPSWLVSKRKAWSLSHLTGLGAVKYCLDPVKITIVQHECRGSQWLMLQGPTGKRNFVKMYYKGKLNGSGLTARFEIRNFLREDTPSHYLCMCFEGPHLWSVTSRELTKRWRHLQKTNKFGADDGGFTIPTGAEEHPGGFLGVSFRVEDDKRLVTLATHLSV